MGFIDYFLGGLTSTFRSTGATETGIRSPFIPDESHLAHIAIADIWPDLDLSQIAPTRESAMRVAACAAARGKIVGAIGGMPLVASGTAAGRRLFAQPEVGRPRAITLAYTVDQMIWHGRAWWEIVDLEADGRPAAVTLHLERAITYDPARGTVRVNDGKPRPETDFIRIDAMHEGLLATGRTVITRAVLVEAAAARAADNPVPSVELHQVTGEPLSKDKVDALVARWATARRGANGGVAYTSPNVEARMHGQSAEQLLITGRNSASLDVARAFGVPAWALDVEVKGSSLTYSNVPSRSRELLDYSLRPYMDAIEGRLSMPDVMPPGGAVRLDPVRLLRGDFADRMNAGKVAIDAGIYSPDEIRQLEADSPVA